MNANELSVVFAELRERVRTSLSEIATFQERIESLEVQLQAGEIEAAVFRAQAESFKIYSASQQLEIGKAIERIESLRKEKEETSLKLAMQEARTTEALRRVEVVETRYWWLFTAIFVALLGLLATLIVALVKR